MTDMEALLTYHEQRDADAFRWLVSRYERMVHSACIRVLGEQTAAEDATQETFLKLANEAGRIRKNPAAWLHSCALNAAKDRYRSERARRERESAWVQLRNVESVDDWRELTPVIDQCVAELAEEDRELLLQYYTVRRTQEDLAAERSISRTALQKRLEHVISRLRHGLRQKGVTVSGAIVGAVVVESAAEAAVPACLSAELCKIGMVGLGDSGNAGAVATGSNAGSWLGSLGLPGKGTVTAAAVVAAAGVTAYIVTPTPTGERPAMKAPRAESVQAKAPQRAGLHTEEVNKMSKNRRSVAATVLGTALLLQAGVTPAATAADGDARAIRGALTRFFEAMGKGDAESMRDLSHTSLTCVEVSGESSAVEVLGPDKLDTLLPPQGIEDFKHVTVADVSVHLSPTHPAAAMASFVIQLPLRGETLKALRNMPADTMAQLDERRRRVLTRMLEDKSRTASMFALMAKRRGAWKIVSMTFPK